MRFKGFFLLIAVTVATAALWPAAGSAGSFKGIVVAKQHGALLVASPSGLVKALTGHASIGSRVVSSGGHAIVVGHATKAHIRGIVVRRVGTTLFLSSNRNLLAIHNRVARRLADTTPVPTTPTAATPTTPAPGAVVTTDVSIANGALEEDDENEVGQVNANSITVTATVKAVAAGLVTLDVQGQTLTVPLPAGLTLPASIVGQTVTVQLSLASDNNNSGGDDHGGGGHHGGDGGGDD
jgi:hypothetical protein